MWKIALVSPVFVGCTLAGARHVDGVASVLGANWTNAVKLATPIKVDAEDVLLYDWNSWGNFRLYEGLARGGELLAGRPEPV